MLHTNKQYLINVLGSGAQQYFHETTKRSFQDEKDS